MSKAEVDRLPDITNPRSDTSTAPIMIASSSRIRSESPLTPLPDSPSTYDLTRATISPSFLSPLTPQVQSPLLRSPVEIIQKVLSASGGDDVQAISKAAKVCRELRSIVYEDPDQALWRQVCLQHYDDPRNAGAFTTPLVLLTINWKKKVQDREFVGKIFRDWKEDRYDQAVEHVDLICSTLLDMYLDLPPTTPSFDPRVSDDSYNAPILSNWIQSPLFKYIYEYQYFTKSDPSSATSFQQMVFEKRTKRPVVDPIISRLHCLLSPQHDQESEEDREWRGSVRETIYSSKNFNKRNGWGPLTGEGKVDWALLDAVSSIMMCNGHEVVESEPEFWRPAQQPMSNGISPARGWGFNNLKRPETLGEEEIWDWAGVEGKWCGCYAFMDYSDWVVLNQPRLVFLNRRNSVIDLSTYHEALGDLMQLDFTICNNPLSINKKTCSCKNHEFESDGHHLPFLDSNLPSSNLLPEIYFHGSSIPYGEDLLAQAQAQGHPIPRNTIRGVVRLTADNPPQVKWTMMVRYGGQDRWRLECVQVGGRGSKRGFFGVWSDASRTEHSPCGPAWYWKP